MKHLWGMLLEAIQYHLDRMTAWADRVNAREKAYSDLKEIVGRKDAKEIRFLAEYLERSGYDPTWLIYRACRKLLSGHPLWEIKAELILVQDKPERGKYL